MPTTDDYKLLVTSEHRDKPLFMAMIAAFTAGFVDSATALQTLIDKFNLDAAAGEQLDKIGEWVGITRRLRTPITGVYFSWDADPTIGWDAGSWQGPYDPDTGIVLLPDEDYRTLLRAKIAANFWDGTLLGAEIIWGIVFQGAQTIILQDNQDMSMTVGFYGAPLSAVQQALLVGGYFPLKPAGVRIKFYAIPVNPGPLFAWDSDSTSLQGWDLGSWVQEVQPS